MRHALWKADVDSSPRRNIGWSAARIAESNINAAILSISFSGASFPILAAEAITTSDRWAFIERPALTRAAALGE